MCGRYFRRSDKQRIAEAFHLDKLPEGFVLPTDYNVAPTTLQPIIRAERETGERELVSMRGAWCPTLPRASPTSRASRRSTQRRRPLRASRCGAAPSNVAAASSRQTASMSERPWTRRPSSRTRSQCAAAAFPVPFRLGWHLGRLEDPDGGWLQSPAIITTDPKELIRGGTRYPGESRPSNNLLG
jgi:putative SOS response-associated peptidase YedK